MKTINRENKCSQHYDALEKKEIKECPEGVEFLEVKSEDILFPLKKIGETIEVRSKTVNVGERYTLSVIGQYKDGCNTLRTSVDGIAYSKTVTFSLGDPRKLATGEISWSRTLTGCD